MKRINIKCPYCGSKALLRPASVVHEHAAPGEEVYLCARFPACDAYVSAHRDSHLPMGTLADKSLRQKRRQAHIALNRLWEQGLMTRKEAYRWLQVQLGRLCTRGLVASGTGETGFEALYDLLGGLYVTPLSESLPLRLAAFLKLTVFKGFPISKARELFRRDRPNEQEAQVMALSRQALLSTAELIKCAEVGVRDISTDEKLMDALYNDDDTTSDNIADMMLTAESRERVTVAIANLYLRKQIIFQRV